MYVVGKGSIINNISFSERQVHKDGTVRYVLTEIRLCYNCIIIIRYYKIGRLLFTNINILIYSACNLKVL